MVVVFYGMPLGVAALIVGGGSKSLALSALTSPPLFSVAKTRFIPKVSFSKLFVCCGALFGVGDLPVSG